MYLVSAPVELLLNFPWAFSKLKPAYGKAFHPWCCAMKENTVWSLLYVNFIWRSHSGDPLGSVVTQPVKVNWVVAVYWWCYILEICNWSCLFGRSIFLMYQLHRGLQILCINYIFFFLIICLTFFGFPFPFFTVSVLEWFLTTSFTVLFSLLSTISAHVDVFCVFAPGTNWCTMSINWNV